MDKPKMYSVRFVKNDVYFLRLAKGQLTIVRELKNAAKLNAVQAEGLKQDLEGIGWGEIEILPNPHTKGN